MFMGRNSGQDVVIGNFACPRSRNEICTTRVTLTRFSVPLIPNTLDANFELRSAIENLHSLIEESGGVITHNELPTLPVSETSLMQIFQNLIGNAIRYRSTAAPRIHISARDVDQQWLFTCRDNGMGIDPQYLTIIFDAFKRLHGADRAGSGLGLSTCKKIVERYGGKIWVESQTGMGSTFFFTLPKEAQGSDKD
jgi:two-component system, chemotaxis family, sensor kinase Cph1